jgi:riboflavin synthase
LERAVRLNDRLGGHLVQGHVNGIGEITKIVKLGDNYLLELKIPAELKKYVVDEGSIAIDGISLTVAKIINEEVQISVIPHTWENTNLSLRKTSSKVNIETDILAKYVEKILSEKNNINNAGENWLNKLGYQ